MDRRHFFAAVAGVAAPSTVLPASESPVPIPDNSDGMMVIHINVGMLPPFKAEAFIERMKDKFRKSQEKNGLSKWETIWMPVRPPQVSEIKLYARNTDFKELEPVYLELMEDRPTREDLFEPTKDYVLLMLGAPVVKIELDPMQLDAAVNLSIEMVEAHMGHALVPLGWYRELVRMGALARAKIMLGRIRSKYDELQGPGRVRTKHVKLDESGGVPDDYECEGEPLTFRLDGANLLEEGREEYRDWLENVAPDSVKNYS